MFISRRLLKNSPRSPALGFSLKILIHLLSPQPTLRYPRKQRYTHSPIPTYVCPPRIPAYCARSFFTLAKLSPHSLATISTESLSHIFTCAKSSGNRFLSLAIIRWQRTFPSPLNIPAAIFPLSSLILSYPRHFSHPAYPHRRIYSI